MANLFGKIVDGTQEAISTEVEESISYIRSDGFKIIFDIGYGYTDSGAAAGGISAWTPDDCNRTGNPSQCVDMNREELRYLRAFLNRPEVAHMLDEQIDGPEDTRIPVTQKPTVWA